MADGYDRLNNGEGWGGGGFVMGLLTGAVVGAGLGMLFAPKSGSDMRNQISEQAGSWADGASHQFRRASDAANDLANRGKEIYSKARDAVSRGAEEAQRYVRESTEEELSGHQMASGSGGMTSAPSFGTQAASPRPSFSNPSKGSGGNRT